MVQIEHRSGLGSWIASPNAREFDIENCIRAVGEDHRGDIERFARLRPQRLQRVHRSAVAVKTDDLPVWTGDSSAGGHWNALSDRATSQCKMIVRLDSGRKSMNAAACRRAFIGNDGAVRKIMGDDLPGRERIERSVRNIWFHGYADVHRLFRRPHRL